MTPAAKKPHWRIRFYGPRNEATDFFASCLKDAWGLETATREDSSIVSEWPEKGTFLESFVRHILRGIPQKVSWSVTEERPDSTVVECRCHVRPILLIAAAGIAIIVGAILSRLLLMPGPPVDNSGNPYALGGMLILKSVVLALWVYSVWINAFAWILRDKVIALLKASMRSGMNYHFSNIETCSYPLIGVALLIAFGAQIIVPLILRESGNLLSESMILLPIAILLGLCLITACLIVYLVRVWRKSTLSELRILCIFLPVFSSAILLALTLQSISAIGICGNLYALSAIKEEWLTSALDALAHEQMNAEQYVKMVEYIEEESTRFHYKFIQGAFQGAIMQTFIAIVVLCIPILAPLWTYFVASGPDGPIYSAQITAKYREIGIRNPQGKYDAASVSRSFLAVSLTLCALTSVLNWALVVGCTAFAMGLTLYGYDRPWDFFALLDDSVPYPSHAPVMAFLLGGIMLVPVLVLVLGNIHWLIHSQVRRRAMKVAGPALSELSDKVARFMECERIATVIDPLERDCLVWSEIRGIRPRMYICLRDDFAHVLEYNPDIAEAIIAHEAGHLLLHTRTVRRMRVLSRFMLTGAGTLSFLYNSLDMEYKADEKARTYLDGYGPGKKALDQALELVRDIAAMEDARKKHDQEYRSGALRAVAFSSESGHKPISESVPKGASQVGQWLAHCFKRIRIAYWVHFFVEDLFYLHPEESERIIADT